VLYWVGWRVFGEFGIISLGEKADMIPDYFWAKTTKNGEPGKSVISHMNDVRAVAALLLKTYPTLLKECNVEQLAAFAGLHDIGKISPGFQSKCNKWLTKFCFRDNFGAPFEKDNHSMVTQFTLQTILQKRGMPTDSAELWAAILGAHHGKPYSPGLRLHVDDKEWQTKREQIVADFLGNLNLPDFLINNSWPFFWWITGVVTVADWIGSAEEWFPVIHETTPELSNINAISAIQEIGFGVPTIKTGLSFKDIFSFEPNDLQLKAEQAIKTPGLYIIEAPMGMGKTEAALWCVYKMMHERKTSGFYFALPTQATSNRIHIRVNDFLKSIVVDLHKSKLVHSGSWLLEETKIPITNATSFNDINEKESIRDAIDWFASNKRGLLAPFGVGTVDQALMSVIAVKHFFVRQFALAGKVIILDEVHSYDLYTGTLIKTLCEKLLPLGCTVVLLSATLTKDRKKDFVENDLNYMSKEPYPLISGIGIEPVEVKSPEPKTVFVQMRNENDTLFEALKRAKQGASILWVCNTVRNAQEMYDRAFESQSEIKIGLLHSRFPFYQRQKLEEFWMEKLGKAVRTRSGCILFSTQIVEQSVDLDADFMISELAPTDMLLQRMGRLWRHDRGKRVVDNPEFWIIAEKNTFEEFREGSANEIKKMFGTKAMVYAPYVLLRSVMLWKDKTSISLPDDIRALLAETYTHTQKDPKSWTELFNEIEGDGFAKKQIAQFQTNVWSLLLDDEEGKAKTRANSLETTQLILALGQEQNILHLLNGQDVTLKGDTFSISEARALAKNIVKVPAYCFAGHSKCERLKMLVRGNWQIGFVENGNVRCTYVKKAYTLRYTLEKGVEIMKTDERNEVDNEPCD